MPTNAAGQVIVNPNIPLGLNDFKQIYTGNGASPAQNASNLLFNAPEAGKSYMEDQWSKLGIPQAPEDYFAAQASSPPSGQASVPVGTGTPAGADTGWPVFPNEAAKQVALANGSYDPSFPSPQAKATYLAAQAIRTNDANTTAAEAAKYNPIMPRYDASGNLSNSAQVLQGQTAGDTNGYSTLVLQSLQGIRNQVGVPANLRTPLQPYVQGYGSGATATGGPNVNIDKLDRRIFTDPQFQQIMSRDPNGAAATYQRLTGRSLGSDIQSAQALQQEQLKTGLEYTQKQLQQGAYKQNDGTWMVVNPETPSINVDNGLTGNANPSQRVQRKFAPATAIQNQWLNQHYTNATGQAQPPIKQFTPAATVAAQQATQDPDVQKQVATVANQLGRPLNPREIFDQARQVALAKANVINPEANPYGPITTSYQEYGNALLGLKNTPDQDPTIPVKQAWNNLAAGGNAPELNWWGKLIHSLGGGVDQPGF